MEHPDGGCAPSTGILYQNTRHESCPSEDSSGLAHHHTPSVAGSCGCPPSVRNPPTHHSNKVEISNLSEEKKRNTERESRLYKNFKQSGSHHFGQNSSFCFSYLTTNSLHSHQCNEWPVKVKHQSSSSAGGDEKL
jgi:hypothetical protein